MEQELISLGILFFFAVVGGVIATRIKQPAVIGLLLVGSIIGPNALNFVKDLNIINMMIEFGTILLLFVIGLEFVVPKLVKIGFKAMLIGSLKIGIIFFMAYEIFLLLGIAPKLAAIFGIILSLSSTVVIIKILESKGLYHGRREMPLLIGILLIEDLIAIVVLTFLSSSQTSASAASLLENLVISITFLVIAYIITLKFISYAVQWFIRYSSDEVITFIALGICIGFSYLAHFLGLPPSIGAFLAGSIIASLEEVKLFEQAIKPFTLTFISLFFISIGTMVNLASLQSNLLLICFITIFILVSRLFSVGVISYLFANFTKEQTIFSSIAMVPVSEFSLLIAQQAGKLNLGIDIVSLTASIIFITALIMSFSINYYPKVSSILYSNTSNKWIAGPESISKYIKLLFDALNTENYETSKLKKSFFRTSIYLLLALFIAAAWKKLLIILSEYGLVGAWPDYAIRSALVLVTLYLLYQVYIKAKEMYNTLVIIIANIDSHRDIKNSRYILNMSVVTLGLFVIAIFLPALIIIYTNMIWLNIIPFILLGISFIQLRRVTSAISNFHSKQTLTFPKYKKYEQA